MRCQRAGWFVDSGCVAICDCHLDPRNKSPIPEFFDRDIEPKALCRNCDYFDCGGLMPDGTPRNEAGGCINPKAPRSQTTADDSCTRFFPCSTRWPDADHG